MTTSRFGVALVVLSALLATGTVLAGPFQQSEPTSTPVPSPTELPANVPTLLPTALVEATPAPTQEPARLEPTTAPAALAPTAFPAPTVVFSSGGPPVATDPEPVSGQAIGQVPLSLAQRATIDSIMPGGEVRYLIQVASARTNALIETRSTIPPNLTLLGASTSNGTCGGTSTVACHLTVALGQSATILIVAQVNPAAIPGSTLISQTLAQDDLSNTAASDQVAVTILASPASSVAGAAAPGGQSAGSSANTTSNPSKPSSDRAKPAPALPPAQLPIPAPASRNESAAQLPVELSNDASAPASLADAPLSRADVQAEPDTIAPLAAADTTAPLAAPDVIQDTPALQSSEQNTLPVAPVAALGGASLLPKTAASSDLIGIAFGLLGFAVVLGVVRRIRRATHVLAEQQLTPQLTPLVHALGYLQRRTATTNDELASQLDTMQDGLEGK